MRRRLAVIAREWQRIDPKYLDEEEQRYWATFAGRAVRFEERAEIVKSFTDGRAGKEALDQFLFTCAAENPNRRLRMMALADRVSTTVDRASFDDLVTLVTQAPPWEKDRLPGGRMLLQAIAQGKPDAPEQILARWTWRLARATRKAQDRAASAEFAEAKRLLGALANSRGHRHEENARSSSQRRASSRCPWVRRCWPRPRDTPRVRQSCSTPPAKSWARSTTWPGPSPRISPSRSLRGARAGAGAARSAAQERRLRPTARRRHLLRKPKPSAGRGDLPGGSLLGRLHSAGEREQAGVLLGQAGQPSGCS